MIGSGFMRKLEEAGQRAGKMTLYYMCPRSTGVLASIILLYPQCIYTGCSGLIDVGATAYGLCNIET